MIVRLYSIKDRVAAEFGPVFLAKNDAVALRQFENTKEQNRGMREEDFQLAYLASMDTETGVIHDTQSSEFVVPSVDMEEDDI